MKPDTVFILRLLFCGSCAVGAADCQGQARSIEDARAAEARVRATFAAYGKVLSPSKETKTITAAEKAAAVAIGKETTLEYQYSPLPKAEIVQRFGQTRIVISDGWLYMMRETLRASAVAAEASRSPKSQACIAAYKNVLGKEGQQNLEIRMDQPGLLRISPAFIDFVRFGKNKDCENIPAAKLSSAQVDKQLLDSEDASLVWLIGWLWHLQYDSALQYHATNEDASIRADWQKRAREESEKFAGDVLKKDLSLAKPAIELHRKLFPSSWPPAR